MEAAVSVVAPIVEAVVHRGEDALREFSQRFDGVTPTHLRVPAEALQRAADELDPDLADAFAEAIRRRRHVAG